MEETQLQTMEETKAGYKKTKLGWIPTDWEISTIGESLIVKNEKRKPISQEVRGTMKGKYPYYGPTKIQDYINEFQYDGTFALIAEDGDHFLKYKDYPMTQLVTGKFNVNNHAHVLKGTEKCLVEWFYWYYNRKSIYSYLTRQGAGRYKLNKAALVSLKIAYPGISEQKAIVEKLFAWERAIEKHEDLIEKKGNYKKGLMQQLLTGKKRLPGYEDKWNIFAFKQIYRPKKVKAGDNHFLSLSVTKEGIVSQEEYFNKKVSSSDTSNYLVVEKGDMVMSGLNFWMGSIDVLEHFEHGIVSPAYKVFELSNNEVLPSFMKFLVRSEVFLKALISSSVQGASIVRRNLDKETLNNWPFKIPSIEEQTSICNVLKNCNKEIELLNKKKEMLQTQKKGLMQQLLTGKKRLTE